MAQTITIQPKAKHDISLKEALKEAQEQAVINGTSNMTLDEINNIIADSRRRNTRRCARIQKEYSLCV